MKGFIKTTLVGGAVFLLPLVLMSIMLEKAIGFAAHGVKPISQGLHLDEMGKVAGVSAATALAAVSLVAIAFLAGMIARTAVGSRFSHWIEASLLGGMPPYRMMKTMAEGMMHLESTDALKPALVNLEDGWQIGYLIEPLADGWLAIFVPQAPTPLSGSVMYFPAERVRPLDITMAQASAIIRRIGVGSGEALRGVDLRLPQM